MLKALDDLEKAVGRMLDKARGRAPDEAGVKNVRSQDGEVTPDRTGITSGQTNEEAAEYVRRAIKRLKSL